MKVTVLPLVSCAGSMDVPHGFRDLQGVHDSVTAFNNTCRDCV